VSDPYLWSDLIALELREYPKAALYLQHREAWIQFGVQGPHSGGKGLQMLTNDDEVGFGYQLGG